MIFVIQSFSLHVSATEKKLSLEQDLQISHVDAIVSQFLINILPIVCIFDKNIEREKLLQQKWSTEKKNLVKNYIICQSITAAIVKDADRFGKATYAL